MKSRRRRPKIPDSRKRIAATIRQAIIISDTHFGCKVAICPKGFQIDEGVKYQPSRIQRKIQAYWEIFWGEWVPEVTKGEPFAVIHVGDVIEGLHHRNTTPITPDLSVHRRLAIQMLKPVVAACDGLYYQIRGTDAHVGPSGQEEETVAETLGAIPDADGRYARHELWKMVGHGLVHCLHHIGTTGSAAYEGTAPNRELVNAFVEAGRWGDRPPDVIVRAHRHRSYRLTMPGASAVPEAKIGEKTVIITPAWQGKTPFTFRISGVRQSQPQFGGWLIREGEGTFYFRSKEWRLERPKPE